MFKVLLTLHVLLAIFLIGPLAMIPMTSLRSIRRRDAVAVHGTARQTMIYGLGSIVVFLLGFGLVGLKPDWFSLGDPWITISMTLYVIALILVLAVLVPGLRKAGKLIDAAVPGAEKGKADDEPPAADPAGKQRLDALYGRTAAISGLVTLLIIAIIVLMVVQPFS